MKLALCGSTKFKDDFIHWNLQLSKAGHVVYSVAGFGHSGDLLTEDEKITLDLVHFRKIAESDAIFVLDVECEGKPYIGFSTKREISWAHMLGKSVFYLSHDTDVVKLMYGNHK